MKPITKHYLKTFLVAGLTFGIAKTISDLIISEKISIWVTLFSAFLFGIIMSSVLGTQIKNRLKKLGVKEITDQSLKVKQTVTLTADITKNDLIEKLKNDTYLKKMKMTINGNIIKLSANWTWKSWGEEIQIIITDYDDKLKTISILSKPLLPTTLVDYGKNRENVYRIEKLITNVA